MSATTLSSAPVTTASTVTPGFGHVLRSEWIKLTSVRSTWWTVAAIVVLGAGLTVLITGLNAEWLAGDEANESPGSFITWGMLLAPIMAVVLGALAVTTEYGTGMIRTTFAAVPRRGAVLVAKCIVVAAVLLVVGTVTALLGYAGANPFLDQHGIGMPLEGDVLRAMYGSGLLLAAIGVMTVAVGTCLRHTAGTISAMLALFIVLGNMVMLVPGRLGDRLVQLMPGNAGEPIATVQSFNPNLLDPWPGYGVLLAETAAVLLVAWVLLSRRDA